MYKLEEAYNRLNKLFDDANSSVIDVTDFICNGTNVKILYTRTEVHDILHISFMIKDDYAVCAFYINNGQIDSYIPNNIFLAVSNTFEFDNGKSTNKFFDNVCEHILSTCSCKSVSETEFDRYVNSTTIKPTKNHDRLYFNHLKKANLSHDMESKIRRIKEPDEANEIIKYLRLIGRTLVFVDDFKRRKNLTLENIKSLS